MDMSGLYFIKKHKLVFLYNPFCPPYFFLDLIGEIPLIFAQKKLTLGLYSFLKKEH